MAKTQWEKRSNLKKKRVFTGNDRVRLTMYD